MASDNIDSAKGALSPTVRPTSSVTTTNTPERASYGAQDAVAHSSLELFQWLVGIHTPPCLTSSCKSGARSDNLGLYQRSKAQERRSRIAYRLTSYIGNILYLVQIMLAAAFTGLSAYKDTSPVTLTVLGALNTLVAGCLAWQKGQGVPQRYRKAQDQYRALIIDIEMTERSFIDLETSTGISSLKLDPRIEKARIQKLFDDARADQQANYPDLYVSTAAAAAKSSSDMAKQLEETKAEAARVRGEMLAKIAVLAQKLEGKVEDRIEGAVDDILKK